MTLNCCLALSGALGVLLMVWLGTGDGNESWVS
jgi:hypothetical protein